ncbi:MAG: hypothetical protein R3A44_30030 [Caldilineaceae bacterium]
MTKPTSPPSSTPFDWAIYADATLAGLAVLIPIPFVDGWVEGIFRRRMPHAIAARRGYMLTTQLVALLNNGNSSFFDYFWGCLLLPLRLIFELIVQLSRKLLYFLTIKRAIDALNYYWQRAFLLDYMLQQGYLDELDNAPLALAALEQTLRATTVSPLTQLARQIIFGPFRIMRSLWHMMRGQRDAEIDETRQEMARSWNRFADFFAALARRYEQIYDDASARDAAL